MIQKCVYFDHSTCMHVLCIYIVYIYMDCGSGLQPIHTRKYSSSEVSWLETTHIV